jgi:hypothetical protein
VCSESREQQIESREEKRWGRYRAETQGPECVKTLQIPETQGLLRSMEKPRNPRFGRDATKFGAGEIFAFVSGASEARNPTRGFFTGVV